MNQRERRGIERVKAAARQVELRSRFPLKRATAPRLQGGQWYWTTGSGGTASVAGSTVSTAVLTKGTVTARICSDDGITVKPDASAADVTLVCGVVPATSPTIASGRFVYAVPRAGRMEIIHVAQCS